MTADPAKEVQPPCILVKPVGPKKNHGHCVSVQHRRHVPVLMSPSEVSVASMFVRTNEDCLISVSDSSRGKGLVSKPVGPTKGARPLLKYYIFPLKTIIAALIKDQDKKDRCNNHKDFETPEKTALLLLQPAEQSGILPTESQQETTQSLGGICLGFVGMPDVIEHQHLQPFQRE